MADEHINVSVRLRPLNQDEADIHDPVVVKKQPDGTLLFTESEDVACSMPYSQVFDEHASGQAVFDGVVAHMLGQALLGKNATVFAYGQTGSGKTYTVDGLMSAAAEFLFSTIVNTPGREFLLKLSAVEVYNEAVHDLLQSGDKSTRLDLVDNREGRTIVKNVVEETLLSSAHLQRMLRRVKENRKVRETCFNVQSSRSHQIVTITVESRARPLAPAVDSQQLTTTVEGAPVDSSVKHSTISFVDLAGSEPGSSHMLTKGKISAVVADEKQRKRESAKINQSLLALLRVIQNLAEGAGKGGGKGHVPFRDSNLTRLLQPCLGGNSKTAIIATVSPTYSSIDNTRATLNFISVAAKVRMRPVVNVVADKNSRIRTLEEEVRMLRSELAAKDNPSQLGTDNSSISAPDVEEALQAQLARNEALTTEKESLARKIAGLERLVLNADPAWRVASNTDALNRSIDVDELPSRATSSTIDCDTPSRRIAAIAQSMPVFNRSMLEQIARGGSGTANGGRPRTPNYEVLRPGRINALHTAPAPIKEEKGRSVSGAAGKPNELSLNLQNPEDGFRLNDNLISPGLCAQIPGFESMPEPSTARQDSSRLGDTSTSNGDATPRLTPRVTPRIAARVPPLGVGLGNGGLAGLRGGGGATGQGPGAGAVPPLWSKQKPQALEQATKSPRLMAMAPVSERGENAVSELLSEVRNVRFGGQPGVESEQMRLARLEVQLQTLQEQQAETTESIDAEAAATAQDIQDLQDEISRMKAARQRKTEALTSLAHLRNNIKQLTKQIRDEGPDEASAQEVQDLVRREALPEWMGHVLSKNCTNSCASGAIAPGPAEDGEVVTSRERPLPRHQSSLSTSISGSTSVDSDADVVLAEPSLAQPLEPSCRGRQPARVFDTPRPGSSLRNTTTSSCAGINVSASARASGDGRGNMNNCDTASVQSQSLGSSVDPDDEIKAIMARAVHGLKAQEAVRFKQHMSRMEARVKQLAESHVANLQNVLQQYQDSNETLEEQKKWLVGRVLQQEMDSSELEQVIADLQAQLRERDSQVAALETELKHERMSKADDTNFDRSFMDTMHSSWGRQPSVDELLSNIVKLWNEMHVPLLVRSQFWLTHQGKDVFYYMAEEGHLLDEQREMENSHEMLLQAKKRLHSERKWLALRLREVYTDEEREELFERWGILQMKERKKALSLRLWDPMITHKLTGQKSSAELTLLLYGWDGVDTSFVTITQRLPLAGAGRVTVAGQSARFVSRAATFLTPRATPRGTPPRSARVRRQNTNTTGMSMDDMASMSSMPSTHPNHVQSGFEEEQSYDWLADAVVNLDNVSGSNCRYTE